MQRYIAQITLVLVIFTCAGSAFAREHEIDKKFRIDSDRLDVTIDIGFGEIEIIPSGKDSELRVYAEYNDEYSEIEIAFNKRKNRMSIKSDQNWISDNNDDCDYDNERSMEITIELPHDPEIDLFVELKAGEADLQLGGLSLSVFEFNNFAGDVDIDFDWPNRIKMNRFEIDGTIGEIDLHNLGNARFRNANINSGIGELSVDFSGDMLDDVSADIDLEIGETNIILPQEIGTRMKISRFMLFDSDAHYRCFDKRGSRYYSDNYDDCDKLLTLNISSGLGEVDITMK